MDLDALCLRLEPGERNVLLDFCDLLLFTLPDMGLGRRAYLDLIGAKYFSTQFKLCAGHASASARQASESVGPLKQHRGLQGLLTLRCILAICPLPGEDLNTPGELLDRPPDFFLLRRIPDIDDAAYIDRVFWVFWCRGPTPDEQRLWAAVLSNGLVARDQLLNRGLEEWLRRHEDERARTEGLGPAFCLLGSGQPVSSDEWHARRVEIAAIPDLILSYGQPALPQPLPPSPRPVVSVITSLYRGGPYIARFLSNITRQHGFADWAELIIIDAASPDGEADLIETYTQTWPNIRYMRCSHRIGIYDAWNLAVEQSEGDYLTNANVDDLRREDSIALQLSLLQSRPDADVVYQDFYYTLDPTLDFSQVAAVGYRSALPEIVDAEILATCNPPHNAPMWRKSLHAELGMFDSRYCSSGDYEFWWRCVESRKRFIKSEIAHAAYFQNPSGVSTRAGSPGVTESRHILRRYRESSCIRSSGYAPTER